jgi:hypothetical protein
MADPTVFDHACERLQGELAGIQDSGSADTPEAVFARLGGT